MHRLFCDEFGNTGPDLVGTVQPLFVYAFVLLSPVGLESVEEAVRHLYARERLPLRELKSSTLWASRRGLRRYAQIGRSVYKNGGRVCLSVVEKRYHACCMIVETYLDPPLHDRVPLEMSVPRFRQIFADACYDCLDDACLQEFIKAQRTDDAEQIARIGERLSARLKLHCDEFVSYVAARMETRPAAVFRYAESRPDLPANAGRSVSQYAAFFPGVQLVDAYLESINSSATLVRGEDFHFGEMLDLAFSYGRRLDQCPEGRAYGAVRQLDRIEGCRSASPSEEFGIQVADLATGLFGRLALNSLARQDASSARSGEIADAWRPTLISRDRHYWMVADATIDGLCRALFGEQSV